MPDNISTSVQLARRPFPLGIGEYPGRRAEPGQLRNLDLQGPILIDIKRRVIKTEKDQIKSLEDEIGYLAVAHIANNSQFLSVLASIIFKTIHKKALEIKVVLLYRKTNFLLAAITLLLNLLNGLIVFYSDSPSCLNYFVLILAIFTIAFVIWSGIKRGKKE